MDTPLQKLFTQQLHGQFYESALNTLHIYALFDFQILLSHSSSFYFAKTLALLENQISHHHYLIQFL